MQSLLSLALCPVLLLLLAGFAPAADGRGTAIRDAERVEDVLARWARASQSLPPLSDGEKRTISETYRHVHSGHELAVALEFRGPVRAADLVAKYRWTGVEVTGRAVRLSAVPRDEVERLFIRGFEVSLDPESHLPSSIRFTPRSGPESRPLALVPKLDRGRVRVASAVRPATAGTAGPIVPTAAESPGPASAPKPPLREQPADGELPKILRSWQAASSRIRRVHATFTRFEYDTIFSIEKRATGTLRYEAPYRGRLDIRPAEFAADAESVRLNARGEPYRLEAARAETWIWTERETLQIDEAGRSFTRLPPAREAADDSQPSLWSALSQPPWNHFPFQVGIGAEDLERRFAVRLTKRTRDTVRLSLVPRLEREAARCRKLDVILDAEKLTMRAIRIVDPAGNRETVYVFDEVTINGPREVAADPFTPDLSRYREQ